MPRRHLIQISFADRSLFILRSTARMNKGNYAWAPRIISKSQRFCRDEEAAKEAAEQENAISTIDKIT
jgi:hypothetical protein